MFRRNRRAGGRGTMTAIRWTPEQLAAHQKTIKAAAATKKMQALGRLKQGQMNKTEEAYSRHLEALKHAGQVLWYKFEGMKFRLADNTFLTPDFMVLLENGELEAHEIKGHWVEDARVKIKVAADMYPLRFIAIKDESKKNGGNWKIEEF